MRQLSYLVGQICLIVKTKNNLSKGCTTKEKHDIIYACFETNYFCMILSGWIRAATLFELIQNKLQKLFKYKCNNNIIKKLNITELV